MQQRNTIHDYILCNYESKVKAKYPDRVMGWPLLCGTDTKTGTFSGVTVIVFIHTGQKHMVTRFELENLPQMLNGTAIRPNNIEETRERIRNCMNLADNDYVLIIHDQFENLENEINKMLAYHEMVMGMVKMKVFLSHKGIDKDFVRAYKNTLSMMGFDVWLDEDAMPAGTNLERGILQGFKDSCAAIFFLTPNYVDQGYLSTEIDYAIQEKRAKGDRFSIITLAFEKDGMRGIVPELLRGYVWKEPSNDLEAIQEVLKALPIQLGKPMYR